MINTRERREGVQGLALASRQGDCREEKYVEKAKEIKLYE